MSWLGAAADALGGLLGNDQAKKDRSMQREFAQNSIQWKVADAKKAGVHPLYALGSMPITPSPSSWDGGASSMSSMGQNISRALMANRDRRERVAIAAEEARTRKQADALFDQQLRKNELDMEYTRSLIARNNSAQLGPPAPSTSPAPGSVVLGPARVEVGSIGAPERSPGAITDRQFQHRSGGGLGYVPSEQAKERMEDDAFQELGWFWRNNIMPNFERRAEEYPSTRDFPLPRNQRWEWDFFRQGFFPMDVTTGRWVNN